MTKIRIATFNLENLLQRYSFYSYGRLKKERVLELLGVTDFSENIQIRKSLFASLTDDSRQHTAQALRDTNADVICLQEVENRDILDDFHEYYLKKSAHVNYGWRRLLDGNDNRGINVAVMSKTRITVESHAHHTFDDFGLFNQALDDYGLSPGDRIFRRDCLEVNMRYDQKDLTLFVCHFKSMSGGRDRTIPIRLAEAEAVKKIIIDKFGNNYADHNWVICGDLNDYCDDANGAVIPSGLDPLFANNFSYNLIQNLPLQERWTHYYTAEDEYRQIDYILLSKKLYDNNKNVNPEIVRNGQPYRAYRFKESRYPRVGFDRPKASDHCPYIVELTL